MHREKTLDFWLTLVSVAALFVPIWGVLLQPSRLISVPLYLLVVGGPAILYVLSVIVYAWYKNKVLLNRFAIGYGSGLIGSLAVHLFLLIGRNLGIAPDLTGILGKIMLGIPLDRPDTSGILWAGLIYHYLLNGSAWGAAYALVFGKTLWWIGTIFGLGVAAVLLISPSFYTFYTSGLGAMGLGKGALLLLGIAVAHIAYGSIIGITVHNYVFPEVGMEGAKAIKPTYV